MRGAKRESTVRPPHQGRWVRLGTALGDSIQRDILFAEKHYEKWSGQPAPFTFDRNEHGEPVLEDFAKTGHVVEHNDQAFSLYGTSDGIMRYGDLRVGLEIKSKQTTYAVTSGYSTRNGPKDDHVKQAICYAIMYDVDYYVILYVNGSKKSWNMTPEEFAKNPDIAAFGLYITPEMKAEVLDHFASIMEAAANGEPPEVDLDKWLFNDYKRTIALSLSEDELATLQGRVRALSRSSLPESKKRGPIEALADIERMRAEEQSKGAA